MNRNVANQQDGNKVAAGYVRVSTEKQVEEGLSLGEQEHKVREFIAERGWEVAEVYVEAGISGRRDDRPELTRLLDNLDGIDVLVIPSLSRLGRSNGHLQTVVQKLVDNWVQLVSRKEEIDTSTASGRLMLNMLGAFAEFEVELISERTKDGAAARARRGLHAGRPPYGYDRDRDEAGEPIKRAPMVKVPHQAVIVERIFKEFIAGAGQRIIARDLSRDGVPPMRADDWGQPSIGQILKNPTYAGLIKVDRKLVKGLHEPIIDAETWARASDLRDRKARTKGHRGGRKTNGPFLFTDGTLRCSCGAAMIRRSANAKSRQKHDVYHCSGRVRDPETCSQGSVRRTTLDGAVFRYFEQVGLDMERTRADLAASRSAKLAEVRAQRVAAESEAATADDRLNRVRRHFQDGKLEPDDWAEQREELASEKAAADARLDQFVNREQKLSEGADMHDIEADVLRALATVRDAIAGQVVEVEGVQQTRAAIFELFEGFTLHQFDPEADELVKGHHLPGLPPGLYIEPHVRDQALEWNMPDGQERIFPTFKKMALSLPEKLNTNGSGHSRRRPRRVPLPGHARSSGR